MAESQPHPSFDKELRGDNSPFITAHKNSTVSLNRPASLRRRGGKWAETWRLAWNGTLKWHHAQPMGSLAGSLLLPFLPEMSVFSLLRTRACAATAAAAADAARLEDPGHACLTSGTEPSFTLRRRGFLRYTSVYSPCHYLWRSRLRGRGMMLKEETEDGCVCVS